MTRWHRWGRRRRIIIRILQPSLGLFQLVPQPVGGILPRLPERPVIPISADRFGHLTASLLFGPKPHGLTPGFIRIGIFFFIGRESWRRNYSQNQQTGEYGTGNTIDHPVLYNRSEHFDSSFKLFRNLRPVFKSPAGDDGEKCIQKAKEVSRVQNMSVFYAFRITLPAIFRWGSETRPIFYLSKWVIYGK